MSNITALLGAYPKHYATVPKSDSRLHERREFHEVSRAVREIIFNEPYQFRSAIITGTNGKGSTGAALGALLRESGFRVGVISSPAINDDCTDMIKVNGVAIAPEKLFSNLQKAEEKLSSLQGSPYLTHYMPICVAAYDYFREQGVDVVVAETAIGGMDDPTVPFKPDVCIFTNITPEHQDVLGDTLEKVAHHKSRIIGRGSKVVLGEEITGDLATAITNHAHHLGATVTHVNPNEVAVSGKIYERGNVSIFNGGLFCPSYQHPNLRLAAEAMQALDLHGAKSVALDLDNPPSGLFPENRFEFRTRNGVTYLFDSAHNLDSYLKLAQSLSERFKPEDLSFFKGASTQESLDLFRDTLKPHRATYVSGYHPRVFAQEGFVDIKDLDFEAEEKLMRNGVIVICGIFLAPKIKPLLFPQDTAPHRPVLARGQERGTVPPPKP